MKTTLSRRWTRRPTLQRAAAVAVAVGTLGGGLALHAARVSAAPPVLCSPAPSFDAAINAKWQEWGGRGGKLGCAVSDRAGTTPDGRALYAHFQNGSIYWRRNEGLPPLVVLAQVRDKWKAMGWERSPVGYPKIDTFPLATPTGELGVFSEFESGAIYHAASTGTHEVHGSIATHHKANFAQLGFPTSDEQAFTDGGRVNYFQRGADYWWGDTGVIHVPANIVVRYSGFVAFEETSDQIFSDSDEVYATVGAVAPGSNVTEQTTVIENVDAGDVEISNIELYRGAPQGITMSAVLMEQDGGDPGVIKQSVQGAMDLAAPKVANAIGSAIPGVGPLAALAAVAVLQELVPTITGWVTDFLGLNDDTIGNQSIHISAKEMVQLSARGSKKIGNMKWKKETADMTGEDGRYRMYFMVYNESV